MEDRNSGIDVLRGVAILLVMQFHMLNMQGALTAMGLPNKMVFWLQYGWIGVDIFFVISAYLLTSSLLRHRGQDNLTVAFYARRALRILPLYWFLLFAGSRMRAWWISTGGDAQFWLWVDQPNMIFFLLFLQNWIVGWIGAPFAHFYLPTWSLAVEEHLYLGLPLLIGRSSPSGLCWLAASLLLSGPIIRACLTQTVTPESAYFWSIAHLDDFGWGVLLALARRFRPELLNKISINTYIYAAFLLILITPLAAPDMGFYKDSAQGVSLAALAGAFALNAAIHSGVATLKIPGLLRLCLAWCGRRCYSLYLLHLPILGVAFIFAGWTEPPNAATGGLRLIFIAILATFGVAAFTYRFIELPFMTLADRIAPYARTKQKSA